jgi:hypothetical protein
VFSSWRSPIGWFRSPLNTLVYKRSDPTEDVRCLYRFVTDKRLFARVILTIDTINFKVGIFQKTDPTDSCLTRRKKQAMCKILLVIKLIVQVCDFKISPTPWSRILEKLVVALLAKKFLAFIKPKGSLPCSQEHITSPCPESYKFSPQHPTLLPKDPFWYYLPRGLFLSDSATEFCVSQPSRAC